MKAIAAMALNRAIGMGGKIPWHLPEDFRWFRSKTTGQVVIMGRKTFEGLKRPLPGRKNYVLTRHPQQLIDSCNAQNPFRSAKVGSAAHPKQLPMQLVLPGQAGTELFVSKGLESMERAGLLDAAWLAGGAQLYEQFLQNCDDLFLTLVKREVDGDAFFPLFEDQFELVEKLRETPEFDILHYRNRAPLRLTDSAAAP